MSHLNKSLVKTMIDNLSDITHILDTQKSYYVPQEYFDTLLAMQDILDELEQHGEVKIELAKTDVNYVPHANTLKAQEDEE